MRTAEIKRRFLDHFERLGHTVVPSAPLPAVEDPNLLFVNAGMVPFVPYFLGQRAPGAARVASVQKCVRTPDIDEVGKTSRHGTFFQMNGNFAFGDYFKDQAIRYAWELATGGVRAGGLGLDPERIWVSVYLDDDEAIDLWQRQIGLPAARIVRRGKADNYWSMGIPGPCGPCSELFYDRGGAYGRPGGPDIDEERYLEFWNLVFMQYERGPGSDKENYPIVGRLPARNIDTGMGLERMAVLLQGVDNLYEIDEVSPILARAAELTRKRYRAHGTSHPDDVRLRVVADHVRAALMIIADGVTPGNEGRGYVLRRILRRAIRAMRLLGRADPALPELLPIARDCMAPSYPEIAADFGRISDQAYGEEETFRATLRTGTAILDTAITATRRSGGSRLSGQQVFQLHDTYGFPVDLTMEIAAEHGLAVDEAGFRALMADQQARAKADAQARKTGHADRSAYRAVLDAHGATEWLAYQRLETESRVLAMYDADGPVTVAVAGAVVTAVLDRTPFYAESGGQASDAGTITGPDGRAEVIDVQRPVKGLVAHTLRILDGTLAADDTVQAAVDPDWRIGARQAHSGTHVVHAALRHVLGPTASQSGSFNRPGYLRLDFGWRGGLSAQARSEVEDIANQAVRADFPVTVELMPLAAARQAGALALFGETYDDVVRVVEIGGDFSRELCGGTHVDRSAQIAAIAVTSESSVGAGQRRIEAVTGIEAFRYLARERDLVTQLAEQLKAPREELADKVHALIGRAKAAERRAERLQRQLLRAEAVRLVDGAAEVAGFAYAGTTVTDGADPRQLAELVRDSFPADRPGVVTVAVPAGTGSRVVIAANPAAVARGVSAADLIKNLPGGRGGGSAALAQGTRQGQGDLTTVPPAIGALLADA
ncbi:alanine--tRNA ligase [Solwaraspora sp. WMMB335]|uniref:alanine--tRNA ligase n=1 Tax=Solwaraspora sp. WMMB335 TaxID=3404118 RepID=UPI003B95F3DD